MIELYFGTGGWSAGWLAKGGRAIGFDIEHLPHHGPVPVGAELVLQDVRTLHGSQFKDATVICASPPCQRYSYMAMPFSRGKREASWQRWEQSAPIWRGNFTLNDLFNACFRLQREASEAAGHYIPLVVENVKGAQPWVGPAKAHYGSYYLSGDVGSVGGRIVANKPKFGNVLRVSEGIKGTDGSPDGWAPAGTGNGSWFYGKRADPRDVRKNEDGEYTLMGTKNDGGSWFAIGSPGQTETGRNPANGVKCGGPKGDDWFNKHNTDRFPGSKGTESAWFNDHKKNGIAIAEGERLSYTSSRSAARKAASAQIARIPRPLSDYIAEAFWPCE